ncbi:hypothetical protein DFJ58DRAFT_735058 [Suillus subalutaceus]|uniref:uncharacterized protein n=1 Tax=Suillus subalutaceus TaxID=48586 RepID=UPI001B871D0E|nr:uncharacterized protein DFJ58DRAFT_735058 [Suillus subalutaceus]KAG1836323.1 hypothetical protein DFJ58DRAFT_735058 [Suillus subalutaceus]
MGSQYSSHLSFSSTPRLVWHAYIEYLWNPHPGSWVSQVAYSFRILAFLLILPVVILTLLDITSYVIARTLGIVDDVKASTSDQPVVTPEGTPSILVEDTSSEESFPAEQDSYISSVHRQYNTDMRSAGVQEEETKLHAYFTGEEDLQLSSVDVLSPSPSQPSSPVLPHENLPGEDGAMRMEDPRDAQDEAMILRRRGAQTKSDD